MGAAATLLVAAPAPAVMMLHSLEVAKEWEPWAFVESSTFYANCPVLAKRTPIWKRMCGHVYYELDYERQ